MLAERSMCGYMLELTDLCEGCGEGSSAPRDSGGDAPA